MRKSTIKNFNSAVEKQATGAADLQKPLVDRIDEEGLFNLFTANIMKLKKKFVR
ncbi:MAG TPA: hypothetical protein VK589_09880 [Chryseolinea sp.]|nr:hypothetical protein [Chryseolinea sp.]